MEKAGSQEVSVLKHIKNKGKLFFKAQGMTMMKDESLYMNL